MGTLDAVRAPDHGVPRQSAPGDRAAGSATRSSSCRGRPSPTASSRPALTCASCAAPAAGRSTSMSRGDRARHPGRDDAGEERRCGRRAHDRLPGHARPAPAGGHAPRRGRWRVFAHDNYEGARWFGHDLAGRCSGSSATATSAAGSPHARRPSACASSPSIRSSTRSARRRRRGTRRPRLAPAAVGRGLSPRAGDRRQRGPHRGRRGRSA